MEFFKVVRLIKMIDFKKISGLKKDYPLVNKLVDPENSLVSNGN